VSDWAKSTTRWFAPADMPSILTWKDPRPARTAWREHVHACGECRLSDDIPRMLKRHICDEGKRLEAIAAAERGYLSHLEDRIEYGGSDSK
jgi:hypothetical protein